MAPVEFEKNIKEKLEERRIDPSGDSWNRIAAQLKSPESKKPGFWPYAVAATLAVVFFSGLWIIREASTDQMSGNPVVEENISPAVQNDLRPKPDPKIVSEAALASDISDDTQEPTEQTRPEVQELKISEKSLANSDLEKKEDVLDPMINEKLKEVVAQVRILEENKDSVSDAEVDLLLQQAQQELLAEVDLQSKEAVDHQALLSGVETEIDKSFRDQVFEKLKLGFDKVRTAVASRND